MNCCPNNSIGRPMKIDKETIAGIVKAVEIFSRKDYDLQMKYWDSVTERICSSLSDNGVVQVRAAYPLEPGVQPAIVLRAYIRPLNKTASRLRDDLLNNDPSVFAGVSGDELVINPQCIEDFEVDDLIKAIKDNL